MTIFGDLQGDSLTGKELRAVLEPLDIKPEATRVALHRLKNNGWIDVAKVGREVSYRLSQSGRAQTAAVSADIYRKDMMYADGWRVFLTDDSASGDQMSDPTIRIGRNIVLQPAYHKDAPPEALAVTLPDAGLPAWLEKRIVDAPLLDLAHDLAPLAAQALARIDQVCVLQRILLLHHWRKMALRPSSWALIQLSPQGAMAACHHSITAVLGQTERLTVDALTSSAS